MENVHNNKMKSVFDIGLLADRIEELKKLPKFSPEEGEIFYSASTIKNGRKCSIYFVFRDGEQIFYDSKEENI